ncbi:YvrJ family protein [Sporomusa malonica]|uniref:YvrJ protein family protein n=1 Tax=Sporomusa malonica TaxID=112901 RepID=A0A1W1Z8F7_9FIRM|nr:YvrJ family protein [Sporomusa malonica]SMC44656.1 YvrJ protein family protein [Sporomusa malonica]
MDVWQVIGQVGFPIAVATWLLVKLQTTLEAFTNEAIELKIQLEAHASRCIKCREGKPCHTCDNDGKG